MNEICKCGNIIFWNLNICEICGREAIYNYTPSIKYTKDIIINTGINITKNPFEELKGKLEIRNG